MADSEYVIVRRKEILDGVRSWYAHLTDNDFDRFYVEYVLPLRALRDGGFLESIAEGNSIYPEVGARIDRTVNRADLLQI
jgi:hypothetical protein